MLIAVITLFVQQVGPTAAGQATWTSPSEPPAAASTVQLSPPNIPDAARSDPYGYERAQCSPILRSQDETLEACQLRVRAVLAAHLGEDLPVGMAPASPADDCRREAAGDRYAVQCGAPERSGPTASPLEERICESRPLPRPGGGVVWTEECRPASRRGEPQEGLTLRLGGRDRD